MGVLSWAGISRRKPPRHEVTNFPEETHSIVSEVIADFFICLPVYLICVLFL